MMPKRIQRRRTSGHKLPMTCIYVGRPTCFGNPFKPSADCPPEKCVHWFRECLERAIYGQPFPAGPSGGALSKEVMLDFEIMAERLGELRGSDLACWCPIGDDVPCHANVLLEFANK